MTDFKGQNLWAVILGGSSGIGLASAKKLAAHGLNLIVVHKDRRGALEVASVAFEEIRNLGVKIITFNNDAVNPSSIKETALEIQDYLVNENGKIHLLLHSVARGNLKPLFDELVKPSEKVSSGNETDIFAKKFFELKNDTSINGNLSLHDFDLTINSMALSLLNWVQTFLEVGVFAENSRIIGLTSEGDKKVWKSYAAVASAKSVLESLIKYMAVELAPQNITANLIQAGVTDTQSFKLIPGSDFLRSYTKERNPNKRLTTPEDIANVVYLLAKEEANWITGSTIIADGGEHLV